MKKAKALQDFWCGSEKISKGDVLEDARPASSLYYRVRTIMIPNYIIENNPHLFECPYEEKLTSEEEDEAARRYMWVPKGGSNVFWINIILEVVPQNWSGNRFDWFCFRCGMIFRTKAEAERAAELMMNGRI